MPAPPAAHRRRPGRVAVAGVLAAMALVVACGAAPEPARDAEGVLDLGPLTGSWLATVRGEGVWQGRWELHAQQGALVLVQPDGALIVPGTIEAFAPGALVLGPNLTCDSNVLGVRPGAYAFELTTEGLVLEPAPDDDGCLDRRTVLTADTWRSAPSVPMPIRLDVLPHPSCDPPPSPDPGAGGTAASSPAGPGTALPLPWELENRSAGIVIVVDAGPSGAGPRTLVAQALPGETVTVDPQRGGSWDVTDLRGRCLVRVAGAARVALRTGAVPEIAVAAPE